MITIYTVAYNEEIFIKFFIDHYRTRFPGCRIVINDNMSTDQTVQIAKDNNCEVVHFDTNNQINDQKYLDIKNNCWKSATTDWVLVCDVDELLDINLEQLWKEDSAGSSIIKSEGYNMVNMENNYDLENIKYGARCEPYDKFYLFNRRYITDINYTPGCHTAKPVGNIKYSTGSYKLYHYKCINPDMMVARYKSYCNRLSDINKKNGWGNHYNQTEQQIRDVFENARTYVKKIIS